MISQAPWGSVSDNDGTPPRALRSGSQSRPPSQPEPQGSAEPEFIGKATEYLRPLLRDPNQAPRAAAAIISTVEMFSGPLPHPQHLEKYEALVPGSAREILDMAKGEQSHRHKMQSLEMIYPYLGWFSGTVGFLTCVTGAIYLGTIDHDLLAGGLVAVPVLGVVGWFVHSRIGARSSETAATPTKSSGNKAVRRRGR